MSSLARPPHFDPVIRSIAFPPDSALPTAQQKRNYYEWLETTLPPAMYGAPNLGTLYDEYATQLTPLTINGAPYSPPLYNEVTAGYSQPPDDVLFTANSLTLPVDKRVKKQLLIGSGGAYMSNEIFYRVARLRELNRPGLPTGHLHVPGEDAAGQSLAMNDEDIDVVKYNNLYNLVQRVKQILAAGINAL